MSRSYKKTPYTGQKKDKVHKKYSNKRIRQAEIQQRGISSGSKYKKIHDSWNICDYGWVQTWKEFKQKTRQDFINHHNGSNTYYWKSYCRNHKMDLAVLDWRKLRWIWYKKYKNK